MGDYATISRELNRAVYYLHYLGKEMIPTHDVQDTCYALHQLGEASFGPIANEVSGSMISIQKS